MKDHSVGRLVLFVLLYVLVVQKAFAWLLFLTRGDKFLISQPFSLAAPMTLVPYAVGAICVVGLALRQTWAWWLTVAALVYELALYAPGVSGWFELSPAALTAWLKLLWLVAIGFFLFQSRPMRSSDTQIGEAT
jgi:hypothetical protein